MSLTAAVTNAASGLAATARGTLVIASNLANLRTPGYARRELVQSALGSVNPNGVRVDGINRVVNESVLAELRRADASKSGSELNLSYLKKIEKLVGNSTDHSSLEKLVYNLKDSLIKASARPDDELRTKQVTMSAQALASKFNSMSHAIDYEANKANKFFEASIPELQTSLNEIARLNRRISKYDAQGRDHSALQDLRQVEIDKVNKLIPIQIRPRHNSQIAVFSRKGAQLLDGVRPVDVDTLDLESEYYTGGEISAVIEISKKLTPATKKILNDIAFETFESFMEVSTVDAENAADLSLFQMNDKINSRENAASRLVVNPNSLSPEPNNFWKNGQISSEDMSSSTIDYHVSKFDKLKRYVSLFSDESTSSNLKKIVDDISQLGSRAASERLEAEERVAENTTWFNSITERYLESGVDSDSELQKLLEYQRAYAANARVIQTVQDMFNQIQRW